MPPRPALAEGKVRHVGDAVAVVIAEPVEQARDAAEQVLIDYDLLEAVVETDGAMGPSASQIWEGAQNNRCFDWDWCIDSWFWYLSTIVVISIGEKWICGRHYFSYSDYWIIY